MANGIATILLGSARLGSARLGSARLGSARLGSARRSIAPFFISPVSALKFHIRIPLAGDRAYYALPPAFCAFRKGGGAPQKP